MYTVKANIEREGKKMIAIASTAVEDRHGEKVLVEPTYSPNLMHWEQNIPTGNIQNKTMTVSLWVKINNSAYWAGDRKSTRLNSSHRSLSRMPSSA